MLPAATRLRRGCPLQSPCAATSALRTLHEGWCTEGGDMTDLWAAQVLREALQGERRGGRSTASTARPDRGGASGPEAGSDVALFLAHRIGIDRRGGALRMAQPALHEIERNPF